MKHAPYARDGPPTLVQRLAQLTDTLEGLRDQVKEAIARAVTSSVADAVHDAIAALLGRRAGPSVRERSTGLFEEDRWREEPEDPWRDDGWGRQQEEEEEPPLLRTDPPSRGHAAVGAALQAGLWWLRRQPTRRPILTTTLVALAAGVIAFIAGSTSTATATALASAAGLLSITELARSAASWATDLFGSFAHP